MNSWHEIAAMRTRGSAIGAFQLYANMVMYKAQALVDIGMHGRRVLLVYAWRGPGCVGGYLDGCIDLEWGVGTH